MEFIYGKQDFNNLERGQENCYLLTNGLGSYSSLTMIGSCARNDHALLMAAMTAPNDRYHIISRIEESLLVKQCQYQLSSQQYVNYTKNEQGYHYLDCFYKDLFPVWCYRVAGVEVRKSLVFKYGENTLGLSYRIHNESNVSAELACKPWLQFAKKGECPPAGQQFETKSNYIQSAGLVLSYDTNGVVRTFPQQWVSDYFYAQDARDGRNAVGQAAATHEIIFQVPPFSEQEFYICYSMENNIYAIDELFQMEEGRQWELIQRAGITDPIGQKLLLSGDCFLTKRDSTNEMTIIAGYPFFGDWGRDTMIAVSGLGIIAGRYEETKSIFRSFLKYCHKGLMPNMFPEADQEPLYNTVDASLLFILAVYEYFQKTADTDFLQEAFRQMEEIIYWYQKGTDYHIQMDADGLLRAGEQFEQVTWMDIRYEDILPTPRHGKPVEINVWWYNSLKAMAVMAKELHRDGHVYEELAVRVKISFQEQFWNEESDCLKDTVSGNKADIQIRCNQIWAVSAPFAILSEKKERKVVEKVFRELYTPLGLRTLSPEDEQFCPTYGGSLFERDMSYHQGTVWPFPMGAYYLAYLKVNGYSRQAQARVRQQLKSMEACLREGCIGQIAEIYDGLIPSSSRGCYAQAWSVGEILKVYAVLEM